ncbi:hypothetical protein [Yinghuangia sp. YIM S09857]|uniref:hypothetical protein n=1 Tax=Yinghuangia sp. YIM S09857 TaxID=3436929 RepID=UPI003F533A7B
MYQQNPSPLPDSPLSLNIRPARGADDAQITIRGLTVADWLPQIDAVSQSGAKIGEAVSHLCAAYNVGSGFADTNTPAPQAPPAGPPTNAPAPSYAQSYNAPPPQAGPPAQNAAPSCAHGPRVYRESKPGAAKAWKAWMCGTPQGTQGQCPPEWIN